MAKMIRIRKPHDKKLEEMLKHGRVELSTGVGLYFSRLREELRGVATIKPTTKDVFELSRGSCGLIKSGETYKYSEYERTKKKLKRLF